MRLFDVNPSCVIKLMQCYRETGTVEPAKFDDDKKPILSGQKTRCARVLRRGRTSRFRSWRANSRRWESELLGRRSTAS